MLIAQFLEGMAVTLIAIIAFVVIGLFLTLLILYTQKKLVRTAPCRIRINKEEDLTKTVAGGQTLLAALSNEGIPVPSPCGGKATCKQCRLQILDGAGDPLETDKATFNKKELTEGWRLSCQFKVKHDLEVHVEERFLEVKEWKAKVVSNDNVATFIKELVVELPEGEEVPYKSGGYLQFHVPPFKTNTAEWKKTMDPKFYADWEAFGLFNREIDFSHLGVGEVIRAYSMASYPAEGRLLRFNIRIATPPFIKGELIEKIPWGICSTYTFGLKPGDEVQLSGPYGESFMIQDARPLVFLIGGAGSSFGRSHTLHLFLTENTDRQVDFWYGARSLKENIYQEEYEKLDSAHDNFRYHLVLSEPLDEDNWPKDDPLKTNFLFRAFEVGQLKKMEEPEECLYYVCGPPLHNSSVLKLLDDYGVPRENIVLDDFGS
ncbi:MAG: Na(+)-translocating NADH-quinone reductase subunit F [Chlamydiales bacterium]|nr:Na(+)-translocating NADH-quinone reductase subunit F [Chlamydiales bacterium]MCH9619834.1 Na(+)-translocating NADH-quinone reductase subunit F [Chlamydiales bacterium]MCH9622739.1 Na(+)-translocating NADH-quinone reductase subunit F [Chlamydiales bacterium]